MPCIAYTSKKFKPAALDKIQKATEIISEYSRQGLDLTLRQLYYQFVARGHIPNNDREYKNLGSVISDAREAGMIDWDAIVDRTRYIRKNPQWDSPQDIISACANQFRIDKWAAQETYTEVWIEKDALIGVIDGVCRENDVPFLACRGYASASEIWNAGHNRLKNRVEDAKRCVVFYLGDHDPSGIDMTRDVQERLRRYSKSDEIEVVRLALNMDQIDQYSPPPNPSKMSDPRAGWYVDKYGDESWELDALDPVVIRDLIQNAIESVRDDDVWQESLEIENVHKANLGRVSDNWDSVVSSLE